MMPALPPVPENIKGRVDYELWELFVLRVGVRPLVTIDGYRNASYGDPTFYRARFEGGIQVTRSVGGQEVLSTGRYHLLMIDPISAKDLLVTENGDELPILQVDRHTDEVGYYFTTIYTGVAGFRQTSTSA